MSDDATAASGPPTTSEAVALSVLEAAPDEFIAFAVDGAQRMQNLIRRDQIGALFVVRPAHTRT